MFCFCKFLFIDFDLRYEKALSDCHECYTNQRRILLTSRCERKYCKEFTWIFIWIFSVQSAIQDLAIKNERDMCTLVNECSLKDLGVYVFWLL